MLAKAEAVAEERQGDASRTRERVHVLTTEMLRMTGDLMAAAGERRRCNTSMPTKSGRVLDGEALVGHLDNARAAENGGRMAAALRPFLMQWI